jgi:2-dehydro-3-deoxyphosphogluconate aldolase/(4S)-4-hydroxy-2-oxoglutarate aldolase
MYISATVAALVAQLRDARVVPVIRTHSAASAATAVAWLRDAGLKIFEITMSVPDAPALIRDLASDPSLLIGAGTVPDVRTARACLDAGARFIVAPWVDSDLAEPCHDVDAALMLGALTPTEVRHALHAGADVVKIFPAGTAGGPGYLKSLVAVFPGIVFCPTGGVGPGNVGAYLAAGAAFVGMGGALVDETRIAAGDRAAIEAAAHAIAKGAIAA